MSSCKERPRAAPSPALPGWCGPTCCKQQARATPFALRPPGALPDADFNALCIKCGQCIRACPYGTLKLAALGESVPLGTPHFSPRDVPCYLCPDIPCKEACPTGALSPELKDVGKARMGLAVIDRESCLSWQGLRCEVCYRACPLIGKAITVETHPRQLSKHAVFVPVVHSEHCTGCGVCEKVCPLEQAAVKVLPQELVQGKIGRHYRLGWKIDTPITQRFKPQEAPAAPASPAAPGSAPGPGLDYLNQESE